MHPFHPSLDLSLVQQFKIAFPDSGELQPLQPPGSYTHESYIVRFTMSKNNFRSEVMEISKLYIFVKLITSVVKK